MGSLLENSRMNSQFLDHTSNGMYRVAVFSFFHFIYFFSFFRLLPNLLPFSVLWVPTQVSLVVQQRPNKVCLTPANSII